MESVCGAFGVGGHVLVKFAAGGHEYLVDPDYGISAYRYDVRRGILRGEIVTKCTKAGWTNASQIYGYVSSRSDNEDYLNPEYASHREHAGFRFPNRQVNRDRIDPACSVCRIWRSIKVSS